MKKPVWLQREFTDRTGDGFNQNYGCGHMLAGIMKRDEVHFILYHTITYKVDGLELTTFPC